MSEKYVYLFSEGNGKMRELLGGKGANLAEMTNLGMPVPQGFTVTTEVCTRYYEDGEKIAPEITEEINRNLKTLEEMTGKKMGDKENQVMNSVTSGNSSFDAGNGYFTGFTKSSFSLTRI